MRLFGDAKNVDSTDRCCTGDCLRRVLRGGASKLMAALLLFVGPYSSSAQDHPLKIGVLALGPRYLPAWHCGQADYRPGSDEPKQDTEPYYVRGLLEQLSKLNYVEARPENAGKPGRRFVLTFRTGTSQQLREFAREFVTDHTDIIVGIATAAIQIAQQETQDHPIPILMTGVSDPVKYGLVQSLARPGGNTTGVSHQLVQGSGRRVELFKQMLPGLKRMLTIRQAGYAPSEISMDEVRDAANRLNIEIIDRTTESRQEIKEVMASVQPDTVDGIMIMPDSHVIANLDLVIETSLARRVPAFGVFDYMAAWGAVAADGPSAREAGADVALYIDKISKGAKPADLAVLPLDPKLVINLKAAQCIGISVPFDVLSEADQVIR
jgi:putative tryptophan/tyrosine transport system substrate-binding protein